MPMPMICLYECLPVPGVLMVDSCWDCISKVKYSWISLSEIWT